MSPRADEMSRRHRYETAFDSKISKSEDDLDVDEVAHKSILVIGANEETEKFFRRPRSLVGIEERLSRGMRDIDIGVEPYLTISTPPSASFRNKFHSSYCVATAVSSPDVHVRSKDLKLPKKSTKPRAKSCLLGKLDSLPNLRKREGGESKVSSEPGGKGVLEIKGRPRQGLKYSSSESMATSSSGGSLESIRSSTSEGNRSTSSCESRHSSSLSSHSSESAPNAAFRPSLPSLNSRVFQLNKLNILSPISDKSSQEPCSEASENNKNNNSEKGSPEDAGTPGSETQKKRRLPQNRNVLRTSFTVEAELHNGSDSGISVLSRVGPAEPSDFSELPFDMPKLRRKKLQLMETSSVQDTSGSATSVDLKDLPFDMPKLRRRQRPQICISNVSQASSTNSIQDEKPRLLGRPSLSLDLHDVGTRPASIDLHFESQSLPFHLPHPVDTSCPLEEQKWYHGSITRNEAEGILRGQKEGSYLVRTNDRAKQDYSLSCKCARGFLHMRIQQTSDTGQYVLGNFCKPFPKIPELLKFYSTHRLPVGAEPLCLLYPVSVQLL